MSGFDRHAAAAIRGRWLDRCFLNKTDVVVGDDSAKALSLWFGEGVMTFTVDAECALSGAFDMGGNMVLDLTGTVAEPAAIVGAVIRANPHGSGKAGVTASFTAVREACRA